MSGRGMPDNLTLLYPPLLRRGKLACAEVPAAAEVLAQRDGGAS